MSRYVMVRLIPCQSPGVRPIVTDEAGCRYTIARTADEFEASSWAEVAARVASRAANEELPAERECATGAHGYAVVDTIEHHYTLDLDTGEVRRWRVLVTVEAIEAGRMTVHR